MRASQSKLQQNCLPHFPSGLPDEHIASRVVRFHIKSGNIGSVVTFRMLFDKLPFALTYFVQPYLDRLAAKLPGNATENLAHIERHSTLVPLYEQFYGTVSRQLPVGAAGTLVRRVVGDPGLTRICPECLVEDKKEHGWAYLHRSHQIPGVTACWKHGRALLERCPGCGCPYSLGKELVKTAWHGCECGTSTKDLLDRPQSELARQEQKLAQFARDILNSEPLPLTELQLCEMYRRKAHELGMRWGPFRINRQKLQKSIQQFYGAGFLPRVDPAYRSRKTSGWMKMFEPSASVETPLYRHVVMAFFLFRNYDNFLQCAKALLDEAKHAAGEPAVAEHKQRELAGDALMAYLAKVALRHHYQIKQLWVTHSGSMKRMVKLDPGAIQKLEAMLRQGVASKRKTLRAGKPRKPDTSLLDDAKWSDAIANTAAAQYASNTRPVRMTANRIVTLTEYHPKGVRHPNAERYPKATKTLAEHAEGQWHFYARRIVWALQSLHDPETPGYIVLKLAGLEYYKGHAVLEFFSDCKRAGGATAASVKAVLLQKKVSVDWEGPCPDRAFKNTGRAYYLRTDRKGAIGQKATTKPSATGLRLQGRRHAPLPPTHRAHG